MDVKFWTGVVENKNDPEKRGRLQVRISGVHPKAGILKNDEMGIGVPTEDLPWAIPCLPLTFGGTIVGTCPPPAVLPGAWVLGISLDGDAYSNLLVLNVISVVLSPLATNKGNADASLAENSLPQIDTENSTCMENYFSVIESIESSGNQNAVSQAGAVGVMQIMPKTVAHALSVTKEKYPEKYANFVKSSGIEVGNGNEIMLATQNEEFNRMIGQGYYSWLLDQCGNDPVLAAASYNAGLGTVVKGSSRSGIQSYISKYGDPRKGELTYEEFARRIEAGGNKETANYIRKFINGIGSDRLEQCKNGISSSGSSSESGESAEVQTVSGTIVLPTQSNVITSKFGPRNVANGSKNHKGIDLRAPMNSLVYAMMSGTVKHVANQTNYGEIYIDHGNGLETRYLHNNKPNVTVGQKVSAGDTIAYAGGRGPVTMNGVTTSKATKYNSHLHFEVRQNGNPVDPEKFLNQNNISTERKPGA